MKNRLIGLASSLIILILLCSGIFTDVVNFFTWLFMLDYNSPNISFVGGVVVRILTFLVSYGLVGTIFNILGYFNTKLMSLAYFIISSLLAFALSYIVWIIEEYIIIISIVLSIVLLGIIIYFCVCYFHNKKGLDV